MSLLASYSLLTIFAVFLPARAVPHALPASLETAIIAAVPIQHDGRWPPLETVAADLVESVTGSASYQGRDPVIVLLAWIFDAPTWRERPLISIQNAELRKELGLSPTRTVFSNAELTSSRRIHALIDGIQRAPMGRKRNPLESKVGDIRDKMLTLGSIFSGKALRFLPDADDPRAAWRPLDMEGQMAGSPELAQTWRALGASFLADDSTAFAAASSRLSSALRALPAAHRPSDRLIATELHSNRLQPFRKAWQFMALGALFSVAAVWIRRGWCTCLAVVALLGGFAVLTYGLMLRWEIAGRVPASNMYESLLFLGWGTGAIAIVGTLILRRLIVPLTASSMGALALLLADFLPVDAYIRPITPVLRDTVWMAIHVPIIMISYAVLAMAVVLAHAQLVILAFAPRQRELALRVDALHYWYILIGSLLLGVGVVTGSMWAASSWGRYWGWDPKEVWSLVALLAYLAILHVRVDPWRVGPLGIAVRAAIILSTLALIFPLLGPVAGPTIAIGAATTVVIVYFLTAHGSFAMSIKSIVAFWMIVMTYVGVNYVLGTGLHSYGFGRGAVADRMFLIGGIDLTMMLVCCIVYMIRRRARHVVATDIPWSPSTI